MISVVIPLYNKEKQIAHTLQTVLAQTFQNFEIVIVNDGSTDNSVNEVEKFNDPRIRLIHQANSGVSAARNKGIEESQYDLIAFLDADDEWKPTYLETQYALFKKYSECSVFACNYEFKNEKGNVSNTIIKKLPYEGTDGILSNYFEIASHSHPPLWTSAIMVKKDAIQSIGGFPNDIHSGEDLLTWAKLATRYLIAYTTLPLSIYCTRNSANKSISELRESAPIDLNSTKDRVGKELCVLYQSELDDTIKKQISHYISYWYKMRAVINMNLNYRLATFKCSIKAISYNPLNFKAYILIFICIFIPYNISIKFLK